MNHSIDDYLNKYGIGFQAENIHLFLKGSILQLGNIIL